MLYIIIKLTQVVIVSRLEYRRRAVRLVSERLLNGLSQSWVTGETSELITASDIIINAINLSQSEPSFLATQCLEMLNIYIDKCQTCLILF